MSKLGPFLRKAQDRYLHFCPACEEVHPIGLSWTFDGNLEAPTFAPSVRHTIYPLSTTPAAPRICHYFIRAGRIEFCGDCTHEFAGKIVPLVPLPVPP